ncbi:hypothetical protein B0A55_04830 [Friedmanniomyces simplex]|uniref:Uncharacterized protein n=1 Tax=Friedmanniomyces simplex TaxID=329884 RepID=A0A4U0XBG4_9PEZI|nr:hypothetical protein B0A55_04830 [Friedmanniomyces simplex]
MAIFRAWLLSLTRAGSHELKMDDKKVKDIVTIVTKLSEPYADTRSNKPPFTDAEVLAMVLLRASKALTFAEIIYHIFKQFAYFGMMATRDSVSGGSPKLALRFEDALRFYDLPLTT